MTPKGKLWSVERRFLKGRLGGGSSPEQIAVRIGETASSVAQKMSRIDLRVVERTQKLCSTSTTESST